MSDDRWEPVRRRYIRLGTGEIIAAVVFTYLAIAIVGPRFTDPSDVLALWAALIPLLLVLIQAGAYWLLSRLWLGRAPIPVGMARFYRAMRVVNVLFLIAGALGVVAWLPADAASAALVIAVWAFGVVEYLNYFVVRLSYPVTTWAAQVTQWRTPRLIRDIARSQSVTGDD